MKKITFLLNVLLLLTLNIGACRSNQSNNEPARYEEMPAPVSDSSLDSLKKIQQYKRDSIRLHQKR